MEEFHESSVVLPLGKYHSTSTIASSRLRLAAVRGAVYPPGYRYLCDLLVAFVWARYVVGSCLQRALVSRTRPSPTRSSGRPSRSMLSRSIPEGCFLKPTSSGPRPSVGRADRHTPKMQRATGQYDHLARVPRTGPCQSRGRRCRTAPRSAD